MCPARLIDWTIEDAIKAYLEGFEIICNNGRITCVKNTN